MSERNNQNTTSTSLEHDIRLSLVETQSLLENTLNADSYESIELNKIETECLKLFSILKRYSNSQVEEGQNDKCNIFNSLVVLISKSIDNGRDVNKLLNILILFLWNLLVQPVWLSLFPTIFVFFTENQSLLQNVLLTDTSALNGICTDLLLTNSESKIALSIDNGDCLLFLAFLNNLVTSFNAEITEIEELLDISPTNLNLRLSCILLKIIELIDVGIQRELSSLILLNHQGFMLKLIQIKSETDSSQLNKSLIDEILNQIVDLLIPKYTQVYIANTNYLAPKNFHYQFFPQQKDSIENSFNLILKVLENGINLCYVSSPQLATNLVLSNERIYNFSKSADQLNLYSSFNKISSKLSLFTALVYQNYLISLNLLVGTSDQIAVPKHFINLFKNLLLPPLPKSRILLEDNENQGELNAKSSNQIVVNLKLAQIYILRTLESIIPEELKCANPSSKYSSKAVDNKILCKSIDLLLKSVISTLISCEFGSENEVALHLAQKKSVHRIIKLVIELESKLENFPLIWIDLLNISSDACSSDLQLVPIFVHLFDNLFNTELDVSDVVRDGVSLFLKKYYFNESCLQKLLELVPENTSKSTTETSLAEIKTLFVDPMQKQINEAGRTVPPNAPSTQAFVSNAARRQSIHVDEFEKKNST